MLVDQHGRTIDYLRLAVTDRCNLRCFYCMPEEGITYVNRSNLLTYEEMVRIVRLLSEQGISKIRITGGEPFLRKDLMQFIKTIHKLPSLQKIHITSNGTLLKDKLEVLKSMGIDSINLSLDTLDKDRFYQITRRDSFNTVMDCLQKMIELSFDVKLNMVVMKDKNLEDIIPMVELTRFNNISVRFIEEMPFNGTADQGNQGFWSHQDILQHISNKYEGIEKLIDPKNSTSKNYRVDGFAGDFGIIAAFSRTFCGTCNRIRITPQGNLKTCLYDHGVFNVRDIIRAGATDLQLITAIQEAIHHKAKDGFEAEKSRNNNIPVSESMATIGG